MKFDEYILSELKRFQYPWYSAQEVQAFKMRNISSDSNCVFDKDANEIIKIFLRGVNDCEIKETKDLGQLIVDLARYAHTASKAYADLASVVSDVIMEAKTNDDDGCTCRIEIGMLARLKSVLFGSELEKQYPQGIGLQG